MKSFAMLVVLVLAGCGGAVPFMAGNPVPGLSPRAGAAREGRALRSPGVADVARGEGSKNADVRW